MNFLSILNSFEAKEVEQLRKQFRKAFDVRIAEEKVYCAKNKIEPQMSPQKVTEIMNLLENHCPTAYHVEALKRIVCSDFCIPEVQDLDERAHHLMDDALKS